MHTNDADSPDYINEKLIPAIVERRPYKGLALHRDVSAGSIYLIIDDDGARWELYATPDFEGQKNTLPLDGIGEDGSICYESVYTVQWTGDLDTDLALWAKHVEAAVDAVTTYLLHYD